MAGNSITKGRTRRHGCGRVRESDTEDTGKLQAQRIRQGRKYRKQRLGNQANEHVLGGKITPIFVCIFTFYTVYKLQTCPQGFLKGVN